MSIFRRAMFLLVISLAVFMAAWYFIMPKYHYQPPKTLAATAFKPSKPLTSFSLIDTNGKLFNEKSLRGHWTLLFFGYPSCPDICPETLGIVRDAWNLQSPPAARFVFASIDPDQVEHQNLKAYLHNYNESFIGITGSKEAMTHLRTQLGVFYKQESDRIDHTASLMLLDPHGRLTAVFTPPFTAEAVARDLEVLTKG
jgi:protein SCO1/2